MISTLVRHEISGYLILTRNGRYSGHFRPPELCTWAMDVADVLYSILFSLALHEKLPLGHGSRDAKTYHRWSDKHLKSAGKLTCRRGHFGMQGRMQTHCLREVFHSCGQRITIWTCWRGRKERRVLGTWADWRWLEDIVGRTIRSR